MRIDMQEVVRVFGAALNHTRPDVVSRVSHNHHTNTSLQQARLAVRFSQNAIHAASDLRLDCQARPPCLHAPVSRIEVVLWLP
jgi:hypothetical protein